MNRPPSGSDVMEVVGYSPKRRIVQSVATSLTTLLRLRETDRQLKETIDFEVPDVWAKLLTTEDIKKAFDTGNVYGVEQAYYALGWWQDEREVEFVNDNGLQERKMVKNKDIWVGGEPDVASFPFVDYFIQNRYQNIDDFIIGEGYLESTNANGETALLYSVFAVLAGYADYDDRIIRLVKAGANLNVQDVNGYSPLMIASHPCNQRLPEVSILLAEKGANLNLVDGDGRTALFFAIGNLPPLPVSTRMAQIKCPKCGKLGIGSCRYRALSVLINQGANLDVQDNDGMTAFGIACAEGSWEPAETLMRAGCNLDIGANESPLVLLLTSGLNKKVVFSRPSREILDYEIGKANLFVRRMLARNVALQDANGEMPVFSIYTPPTILLTLIEHARNKGILNPNIKDFAEKTPLQHLIEWGNIIAGTKPGDYTGLFNFVTMDGILEDIEIWLDYGADINMVDPGVLKQTNKQIVDLLEHKAKNRRIDSPEKAIAQMDNRLISSVDIFSDLFTIEELRTIAKSLTNRVPPEGESMEDAKNYLRAYFMGIRDAKIEPI